MQGRAGRAGVIVISTRSWESDARTWAQCQTLAAAGYVVSLVCPRAPGRSAPSSRQGVHLYEHRWRHAPMTLLAVCTLTLRAALRYRVAVLQWNYPSAACWAFAAPFRLLGTRLVYDQGDDVPVPSARRRFWIRGWWLRRCQWLSASLADRIVTGRDGVERVSRTNKVLVLENPPGPMRPPDAGTVQGACCYVGSFSGNDVMLELLHIWAVLVHGPMGRHAELVLIGEGGGRDLAEVRVRELDLREHVRLVSLSDDEKVSAELSAAALGLFAWSSSPVPERVMSGALDQLLSYGLPIVAYDLPEVRGALGSAALYVPVGDSMAFAAAVAGLLDNPDRRGTMSVAAGIRAHRFMRWRAQAAGYVRMLDELIGVRPSRLVVLPRPRPTSDEPDFVVHLDARVGERRRHGAPALELAVGERRAGDRRGGPGAAGAGVPSRD